MHVFLTGMVIRLGMVLALVVASVLAISVVPEPVREAIRAQPDWLEFVELLVLSDLCFYVAHRLCHAVPALWRFHAVHHSSEHLDWLATFRVHPIDQIFNSTLIALPALVLGFSPLPLLIYALIYRVHSPMLHSNVRISLGALGWLVTTPRFHHWHHADQIEAHDHNFGGQLTIFDRLFGTHYVPGERSLPVRYGTGGAIAQRYLSHLLQPFGLKSESNSTEPVELVSQPVLPSPISPGESRPSP
ncbi:sterol desaturase family protein [Blastomonas aquatica]|nr:sterol desaturase family protein [Blastomonas aquatica]